MHNLQLSAIKSENPPWDSQRTWIISPRIQTRRFSYRECEARSMLVGRTKDESEKIWIGKNRLQKIGPFKWASGLHGKVIHQDTGLGVDVVGFSCSFLYVRIEMCSKNHFLLVQDIKLLFILEFKFDIAAMYECGSARGHYSANIIPFP